MASYLRGVNDSGAEFGTNIPGVYGTDYQYDSAATFTYLGGRRNQVIRLPFKWERIQPTRNAALDATELGRLQTAVSNIAAAGMKCILDVHNYARYHSGGVDLVLGTDFQIGDLSDLWTRLSTAFKGNAGIYGYGLMNEPHDLASIPGMFSSSTTLFDFESGVQGWAAEGTATAAQSATQVHDGANSLALTKTLAASGSDNIRANVGDGTAEGGNNAISAWVWIPGTAPGNWSAFLQIQDSGFTYRSGTSYALTKGAWTQIPSTFADNIWSGHHAFAIQLQTDGANGSGITCYVDTFQQGALGPTTTGAQVWQNDSQTLVNAIRANNDNTLILIPGYSFSGAQSWTSNHPTPWITDSANNFLYEGHYYFDTGNSGTYPNSFATETTNATNGGYTSLSNRAQTELKVFLNWLKTNNVSGFLGEFGWPHGTANDLDWQAVGSQIYNLLDQYGVGGTMWGAGELWGTTYPLSPYDTSGGSGHVDTPKQQAIAVEAHIVPTNPIPSPLFVASRGGQFYYLGKRFEFVGFNAYDLGVVGTNSPSLQLSRLAEMQKYGATVVRTWAYGESNNASPQSGLLQYGTTGGQWNETAFVILDNAVAAAKQLGMKLSLVLSNNFGNYGGKMEYVQYYNTAHTLSLDTTYGDNFHDTPGIIELFKAFILKLLTRVNTVTGVAYNQEPAIFAWELMNEPRYTGNQNAMADTNQNTLDSTRIQALGAWFADIANYIKSLDSVHMVGTGSITQAYDFINNDPIHNGTFYGEDFNTQHQIPAIDYADFHLYPAGGYNSHSNGVADCTLIWTSASAYQAQLKQYQAWAVAMNKPLVVGECGIDKRNTLTNQGVPFYPRDAYFSDLFSRVFPGNDNLRYNGVLLWNYDNPAFPDTNFGIDATVTQTDPSVGASNTTDTALLAVVSAQNLSLLGDELMATFTTAQCTAMADNLAQTITDALADMPASVTQINTDLATEVTRIQAFTDSLAQSVMESAYTIEQRTAPVGNLPAGRLYAALSALTYAYVLAQGPFYIFDGLDFVCSQVSNNTGLANYLVNNTLTVDQYFADAFNQFCLAVTSGSYIRRYGTTVPAQIASAQIFTHSNVDTVNIFTTTGGTTGNLTAGSASLAKKTGGVTAPGCGIIECYAGNTLHANSYGITVTYTDNLGNANQTITVAITGASTNGTVQTPSANVLASAITGVAITSGASGGAGDILNFRLKPARTIAA